MKKESGWKQFFKSLGPGLITGASDDDPSGIATYSQVGAQFGLKLLWTSVITFPLMSAVQIMCAKIGYVTSCGLTGTLKKHYSKPLLYVMLLFSAPAIILNIGADIAGMGAVTHLLVPKIHASIFSVIYTAILMVLIIYLPYQKISSILKYLCVVLLVYLIVPFLSHQDFGLILKSTFIPTFQMNKSFINMFVAILGTTISPYLFFWQATMEAEELNHNQQKSVTLSKQTFDKDAISRIVKDVDIGMLFSNLVMFFIILTTGTVLYNAGTHHIDTVEQAAKALQPVAGDFSYYLFAIGVIGTGLLTIPVLSGSLSYIFSETFGWTQGLDKKFFEAKAFYLVIILSLLLGLAIIYLGISPIKALIYTAILYGVTAPVLIAILIHICNNKKIMKEHVNGIWLNVFGGLAFFLMLIAAIALIYFQFFGSK